MKRICSVLFASLATFVSYPSQAVTDSSHISANLLSTPFGVRPQQCVHEHPSGTTIKETANGVEAIYPDGKVKFYPAKQECLTYDKRWKEALKNQRENHIPTPTVTGWLDYASWTTPSPIRMFSGTYTVPNDPAAGKLNYWLYYFLGIENFQTGVPVTILQSVLAWSNLGWTFASWNCCPNGQAHVATAVPVTAKSIIFGRMHFVDNKWVIDSVSGPNNSILKVDPINRVFNWVTGALETYYTNGCPYYPTDQIKYDNIVLQLNSGIATPGWGKTGATECNGKTTIVDNSQITIKHN